MLILIIMIVIIIIIMSSITIDSSSSYHYSYCCYYSPQARPALRRAAGPGPAAREREGADLAINNNSY